MKNRTAARTARAIASMPPYVPTPGYREKSTITAARSRARDLADGRREIGDAALDARVAVDCALEHDLIRDLYDATMRAELTARGVTIIDEVAVARRYAEMWRENAQHFGEYDVVVER